MKICSSCKGTSIKLLTGYKFHDVFQCMDCPNWTYNRIDSCCRKPFERIVLYYNDNEPTHIYTQCLNCFGCLNMTKPLSKKNYGSKITGEFDLERFTLWKADRSSENETIYEIKKHCNSSYVKYQEYLLSSEWKTKREIVFKRDNFICQKCKKVPAMQIHHLSYKNLFHEPLEDLVSVCELCHIEIHSK